MKAYLSRSTLLVAVMALGISLLAAACGGTATAEDAATTPDTATASGSIVVSGLVDYPMTFVTLDTDYMDWTTVTADDPTAGSTTFDGVSMSEVFTYVGVQPEATTVLVTGGDGSTVELTLADIGDDALLTVTDEGAFALVIPGVGSETWIDDVVGMEFE